MTTEYTTIDLWQGTQIVPEAADDFRPRLDLYPLETDVERGAVLICPGGGYSGRADHEGRDIARFMNSVGLHAFVVQYRVEPNRYPAALNDAARAMRILRARADEWRVRRDKIAVCGFSAGGHLAASLSVFHERTPVPEEPELKVHSARPDASVLCYAVISSTPGIKHEGSYTNLLSEHSPHEADCVSPEKHVNAATPPAFLWYTFEDMAVNVENGLSYAHALKEHGVPFELHVFPHGRHGLGLAPDTPGASAWPELCRTWLQNDGFMPAAALVSKVE